MLEAQLLISGEHIVLATEVDYVLDLQHTPAIPMKTAVNAVNENLPAGVQLGFSFDLPHTRPHRRRVFSQSFPVYAMLDIRESTC